MNKAELQKVLAQRVLARRHPLHFTKLTYPQYQPGWVHHDICTRLKRFSDQVAARMSPRLMLLMPPRHGKALADDTPIFVRDRGWDVHGNLKPGDEILGLDGFVTVVNVSDPVSCEWIVETTHGVRIQCHENHEWAVDEHGQWAEVQPPGPAKRKYNRTGYRKVVISTADLAKYKQKRIERTNSKYRTPDLRSNTFPQMWRFYLPRINLVPRIAIPQFKHRTVQRKGRPALADVYRADAAKTGRCIQVSSPDGVYLCTRDFIPTHNSELASIRFPAWHLGHYPTHEVINVGYNLELPMRFSRKVREVVRDPTYRSIFPDTQLDKDSQSVEAWNTTKGGGLTAAGVGGGITGKGAHILIIDDPLKNQEEADSVLTRDKLWEWYQSTAYTRLSPGGGLLVIETWWNDDDLAGRLQAAMARDPEADQFEVIRYPALSTQYEYRDEDTLEIIRTDEPLPKKDLKARPLTFLRGKDQCLHEDRYPEHALKRIRANLAPRIWSALYQQNPVPDEGMYFRKEYFRYQRATPPVHNMKVYTAWDFAIGERQHNDWNVGATILQDETDTLHVLDITRFRGDSFVIVEAILDVALRFGVLPTTGYTMGVEDGQIWRAIEPLLKKRMTERKQYPSYKVLRPMTDKMARARPLQGRMQQQRVVFPEEASWLTTAQQELLRFPAGAHDDIVDALAWVVQLCMGEEPPQREAQTSLPSWKDKLFETQTSGSHMAA